MCLSAWPRAFSVACHGGNAMMVHHHPPPNRLAETTSRVPLRTMIALIETSLSLPDPIKVTTALFFREDGTIDPTPALDDEDSWKELAPYGREHLSRATLRHDRPNARVHQRRLVEGTPRRG
ncbi:hypothetical protein EV363DRAFT_1173905 [Boletus edulis]|nr:hypothetical protein EV363DRAFT_1173905 [Boletus edulis]